MPSSSPIHNLEKCRSAMRRYAGAPRRLVFLSLLFSFGLKCWAVQAGTSAPEPPLPEAPQPMMAAHAKAAPVAVCQIKRAAAAAVQAGAAGAMAADPNHPVLSPSLQQENCPPLAPLIDWYARFLNGPQVRRMTPGQKAWLATRDVIDPFNGITILGNSAIYVGANSHSAYGPGMGGFWENVGVSYSQDMTGEFFGTFLIPSLVHQDPHYHRLPNASMKRRIAHALYQVVWTQGDDGNNMLNYANLVGFALDDEIGNLYVPGQETDLRASAKRYAIGFALAPVDNFITEFVPDLAKHIHIRVVLVQRIINQVATTESAGQ